LRETGTATDGIRVERTLRRNANTTRITSRIEMPRVICTSCTEARMVRVASMTTESFTVGGIEAWNCGSSARMPSTVSMMFAPGWRLMMMMMAGWPLERPPERMSSTSR